MLLDAEGTAGMRGILPRLNWKRLLVSVAGGVSIIILLFAVNGIAARLNNGPWMNTSFMLLLWTWGIFGSFFDKVTGTQSVWLPNVLGLPFTFLFDLIVFSGFCYCILWVVAQFRKAFRGSSD
jgi:hypothetical protein